MKRLFISSILCYLVFQMPSLGQSFVEVEMGMKPHPSSFFFGHLFSVREDVNFDPIYNAAIGLKENLPNDAWHWELGLHYWHTRTAEMLNFSGHLNDPAIPPPGKYYRKLNFGGLNAGAGYAHRISRSQQLSVSTGLENLMAFASKFTNESGETIYPMFVGNNFMSGIFYGLYVRPAYQFRISRNLQNPWYASIFLKSDMLFRLASVPKPIFLWGAGLRVSYEFRR